MLAVNHKREGKNIKNGLKALIDWSNNSIRFVFVQNANVRVQIEESERYKEVHRCTHPGTYTYMYVHALLYKPV